jgi:hypothetical protein
MTGGLAGPSAASEAAMRSAGELPMRPRAAVLGSSGWSGGRFGSIGRRSPSSLGEGLPLSPAATTSDIAGGEAVAREVRSRETSSLALAINWPEEN